jgi:chromosome segregation ATPase
MTVVEGFKKKGKSKVATAFKKAVAKVKKATTKKALAKTGAKVKKAFSKKSMKAAAKKVKKAFSKKSLKAAGKKISNSAKTATDINNLKKQLAGLKTNSANTMNALKQSEATMKKNLANLSSVQTSIKGFESSIKNESRNVTNQINAIKPQLSKVEKAAQQIGSSSGDAIAKISGYSAVVEKSVAANKQVSKEIDDKAKGIGTQIDSVKKYVDQAKQYSDDIDKKLAEFQKSAAVILAQMQLTVDNNNAAKLGITAPTAAPKTQGFQNMNDSGVSINTAYNGQLQLEGFSTVADSAYLNSSDLFELERNVVLTLKEFNDAYYAYRKCLRDTPTISSNRCATELSNLTPKKDAVIAAVTAFNLASAAMKAKIESTSTSTDNGKRITQAEFEKRHSEIKTTASAVSALRAELDFKMANLLDNSKGPFPEAKTKYSSEKYMTIGWSILATSILYYVFVEMK